MAKTRPLPGPGLLGPVSVYRFQKNPIQFFAELRRAHGEVVGYQLGSTRFVLLFEPEMIQRVFMDTSGAFQRDEMMRALAPITGQGLFSIDGELWRRHRRLMSPAMQRTAVQVHASASVDITREHLARWAGDSVRHVYADMMQLSMDLAAKSILNLSVPSEVQHLVEGMDAANDYLMKELMGLWRLVPDLLPAQHRRRFARARRDMVASIERCIERRRAAPAPGHDLLQLMLASRAEDGSALGFDETRDEILSMILASYETTALALTFSLHAIARQPRVQERLRDEVARVLGSEDASAESCKSLEFTRAVIDEALRLYPPVWVVARQTTAPVEVGGHELRAGTQVLMPSSIVQRDPRWYEAAEQFRPERWLDGSTRPRFAYFPFGGGPRTCIGNHMALQSTTLVLATLVQHAQLDLMSSEDLRFTPSVTLRPQRDIRLKLRARAPRVDLPGQLLAPTAH